MKITWGDWKGWEVYIETKDGNRLPEHRVAHHAAKGSEPATTKVFVEYTDGQEFAIYSYNPVPRSYETSADYRVDGRRLQSLCRGQHYSKPFAQGHSYERVDGKLWTKNLRFEPLKRVTNGCMVDDETAEQLGTITVLLEKGRSSGGHYNLPYESPPPKSTLNASIKPDCLTSYVGGQALTSTTPVHLVNWTNTVGSPPYRIVFYYFTRKTLMAMNIIPNPETTPILRALTEEADDIMPFIRRELYNQRRRGGSEDSNTSFGNNPDDVARYLISQFLLHKKKLRAAKLTEARLSKAAKRKEAKRKAAELRAKTLADSRAKKLADSRATSVCSDISTVSYNLRSRSITPSGMPNAYRRNSPMTENNIEAWDGPPASRVKRRRQATIDIRV